MSAALAEVYADAWGRIVATLIRLHGDWDLAEECAQDAVARALETWPRDGVPANPGGWLSRTARNRAVDVIRRRAVERTKLREAAMEPDRGVPDDRLELIFACCHPALTIQARVALTLRSLGGLSPGEIARAFLVPEKTMSQRLFRAKAKIRNAVIPFRVPADPVLPERLGSVLAVLYLIFNAGYGDPGRASLAAEAIRLGTVLVELMPDEPEAVGLLALMTLHEARRPARFDADGTPVPLAAQDRARWDRPRIDAALARLEAALRRGRPGPYQIQAAIAACHATAPDDERTDWPQIAALYGQLARHSPGPVVELNRAVAIAAADGPAVALPLVDALAEALDGYYLLPATRADLLRRLGRTAEADAEYRKAAELAPTEGEREFLRRKLVE